MWQSRYKREYREKEKENQFPINTVVLHPNEAELIAGDSQGNLKIYDLVADKIRLN
jgi:G protein beta subunit-like protein